MSKDTLKLGQWNAICDVCGFKFKASQLRKRWDNAYVCKDDYEERHPMDFFRGFPDDPSTPWNRPEGEDSGGVDIEGNTITYVSGGPSNVAGQAIAGAAIAGYFLKYTNPL